MKSSLSSLLKSLPEPELPAGFSERIFSEITQLQERKMRRAILFSWVRIGISGLVSLLAIFFAGSTILGSEFAQLFSLIVSDTLVLTTYGRELFWLFLETFPTVPFALLFVPLFFFLLSLGMHATVKNHSQFPQLVSIT
ncbi:MAG: hypothetical protein KBC83_01890 [Candidatus Moranbacteria bacterium]|nr:hypothetical protein [Candidatus Moranbacteria bacterium]MBP9801401.1 hypothetical protein [Candidatus Moranbacteria bacterium]